MATFGKKLRTLEGEMFSFWCPGCNISHNVGSGWKFNGNCDAPTFSPSVLVTSGHYVSGFNQEKDTCWCKYNAEQKTKGEDPSRFKCERCHSFITDGTHALAGQTVDLPDFP